MQTETSLGRIPVTGHCELIIGSGSQARSYPLARFPVKIGRSEEMDLVLDNSCISRVHATIEEVHGSLLLRDEGSRNGIYVNGHRIINGWRLNHGDLIEFGGTGGVLARFDRQTPAAPAGAASAPQPSKPSDHPLLALEAIGAALQALETRHPLAQALIKPLSAILQFSDAERVRLYARRPSGWCLLAGRMRQGGHESSWEEPRGHAASGWPQLEESDAWMMPLDEAAPGARILIALRRGNELVGALLLEALQPDAQLSPLQPRLWQALAANLAALCARG